MKKAEKTEKKENCRLLSIFIDNIVKEHLIVNQKTELTLENPVFIVVRNGSLLMKTGGYGAEMKMNDGVLLRAGQRVLLQGMRGEECCDMITSFRGSGVPGMLQYMGFAEMTGFCVKGSTLAVSLDEMQQSWETGEYFRAALMLQMLLLNIKETEKRDYRRANLNDIYQYIQEHYAEPLDLNQLAQIYGTSVSYFSRAFREQFHMSPMAFVNQIRIHYARLFLSATELKIQEVAQRCGFEKLEYFCYVFKKSEGCTPSQYRANWRHAHRERL